MYSRSRATSGEDGYRSNLPPSYSGSRFLRDGDDAGIVVTDERRTPAYRHRRMPPHGETDAPTTAPIPALSEEVAEETDDTASVRTEEILPETAVATVGQEEAETTHGQAGKLPAFLSHLLGGLSREDVLLLVLLLLLSAESEGVTDILVILLVLIGIR